MTAPANRRLRHFPDGQRAGYDNSDTHLDAGLKSMKVRGVDCLGCKKYESDALQTIFIVVLAKRYRSAGYIILAV